MKNLYREYFHIPKDKHMSTKAFTANLILSVVSILACTFALFATSYAWFSVEVSSEMNTIQAASVFHTQTDESGTTQETAVGYTTRLAPMDEHLFHIYPGGTATTGYCKVILTYEGQERVYYTEQIPQESYLELKIIATAGTEIAFESYWGNLDDHGVDYDQRYGTTKPITATFGLRRHNIRVEEGETIPGPATPYLEHQFPQYATMEAVAAFYGIDMEDILIFNGIEDPAEIEIGDWIKLPYVDEDAEVYVAMPEDIEHVVQEGETLESIAELYDISIEELIAYNELQPYVEEEEEPSEGTENPENIENSVSIENPGFADGSVFPEHTDGFDVIEEEPEPVYVLTPGEILLIPFYAETGYTSSDAVREEDFIGQEPGYFGNWPNNESTEYPDNVETQEPEENKPIGGILRNDNEEDEKKDEEEPNQSTSNVSGVLTLDGYPQTQKQEPEAQPEPEQSGILRLD